MNLRLLDEFYLLVVQGEEQRYKGWTAEPLDIVGGRGWPLQCYHMKRSH